VKLNVLLESYAVQNEVLYLNYFDKMNNDKGGLQDELTSDGVHVTKKGYELMSKLSKEFVSNAIK
jgi:lysophospholipase L1-like esterase